MPVAMKKKIIQLQSNFFWSKKESRCGVPLVAWETIQRLKYLGGLGVGNLVYKNVALLFKWWCRFVDNNDLLWKRVIIYDHYCNPNLRELIVEDGEKGGLGGQVISNSYSQKMIYEVMSKGLWWKVGKGNSTIFWEHKWVGDIALKEAFPRLYNISNQKMSFIIDMEFRMDNHGDGLSVGGEISFNGQHNCMSSSFL